MPRNKIKVKLRVNLDDFLEQYTNNSEKFKDFKIIPLLMAKIRFAGGDLEL